MPKDIGSCVSKKLLFYRVKRLSIINASIIPIVPTQHIQSTMYAISKKAADIIKIRVWFSWSLEHVTYFVLHVSSLYLIGYTVTASSPDSCLSSSWRSLLLISSRNSISWSFATQKLGPCSCVLRQCSMMSMEHIEEVGQRKNPRPTEPSRRNAKMKMTSSCEKSTLIPPLSTCCHSKIVATMQLDQTKATGREVFIRKRPTRVYPELPVSIVQAGADKIIAVRWV